MDRDPSAHARRAEAERSQDEVSSRLSLVGNMRAQPFRASACESWASALGKGDNCSTILSHNLSPRQQSLIPTDVERVVQLDDGRAIAILESNPEWAEASGLKAGILLVNQNGQWLVDQLVLVQDS